MAAQGEPWNSRYQQAAPQDGPTSFRYQALPSRDTFRLLRVYAGQGDRIACSLHHYTLGSETCPTYRAISYTWGEAIASHNLHLSDDTVIKVRKNLKNALRSVRDKESDCWLWIDAVCINQESKTERNHQVRLMAEIYGNANVVLVWLQSANKRADMTRAFKFVHAATTYDDSQQSIYRYSKAHQKTNKADWRCVKQLCTLRYWTRKWIIQELVSARTIVLQAGKSQCSMTDFETFCRKLHYNRDNNAYNRMNPARRETWKLVLASPAARLAIQRLEAREERRPRLLHELVERYASSRCKLPCDHVYALYSLVGEHRRYLSIDYAATPAQRLSEVLRFVYSREQLRPSRVFEFADLLMRLLKVKQGDIQRERARLEHFNVVVPPTVLGTVKLESESEASIAVRRMVEPLDPIPGFTLDTSQEVWALTEDGDSDNQQERVGRPDMTYFTIPGSDSCGLAACRLEAGDTIWHLSQTQLVFTVRRLSGHTSLILGRSYLFRPSQDSSSLELWLKRPTDYNSVRQGERYISLHWATLIKLGSLAVPVKDGSLRLNKNANQNWFTNAIGTFWKDNRFHKVTIAALGQLTATLRRNAPEANGIVAMSFVFLLAVVSIQAAHR